MWWCCGASDINSLQISVKDLPSDAFSGPLSEGFNIITLLSLLAERLPNMRHSLLDLNGFDAEDRCVVVLVLFGLV